MEYKTKKIVLHVDNILREIDQLSYKLGETVLEGTPSKDAVSTDSDDTLDGDILRNLLDARDAQIRKRLAFCLTECDVEEIHDCDCERHVLVYEVSVPEDARAISMRAALTAMHDYMVKGTLMDWYNRIGTAYGATLAVEVQQLESRIIDTFRLLSIQRTQSNVIYHTYHRR